MDDTYYLRVAKCRFLGLGVRKIESPQHGLWVVSMCGVMWRYASAGRCLVVVSSAGPRTSERADAWVLERMYRVTLHFLNGMAPAGILQHAVSLILSVDSDHQGFCDVITIVVTLHINVTLSVQQPSLRGRYRPSFHSPNSATKLSRPTINLMFSSRRRPSSQDSSQSDLVATYLPTTQ